MQITKDEGCEVQRGQSAGNRGYRVKMLWVGGYRTQDVQGVRSAGYKIAWCEGCQV